MATNDLLSRYKKQKKAEAEKDITHNNSTSDSPFTLSKYREMKKNNQVNYDTQIVNDWFNNADKYMTSVSENTSTQPAYNWINENSQFYADNFSDLLSQSDYVRTYINSLKGTEQYDSLQKQFDSYNENLRNYKDYLSGLKDFASKFADEEHYNNAVNNIDNSETDLEKASKYSAYSNGGNTFDDKKISDFLSNPDSISNPKDFASGLQNLDNGNGTLKYWETQDRLRDVENVDTVPIKEQFAQYQEDSDMLFNQDMEEKYGVSDYDYDELVKAYDSTDDYREKEWLKDKFHSVATSEQLQQEYDRLTDEYNSKLQQNPNPEAEQEFEQKAAEYEQLINKKKQEEENNISKATYESYAKQDDFADNSNYIYDGSFPKSFFDPNSIDDIYNAVNYTDYAKSVGIYSESNPLMWNDVKGLISSSQGWKYEYLNDEEKKTFNYIYNTEGKDKAQKYLDYLEQTLNQRMTENMTGNAEKFAKENPVGAKVLSYATNLGSGQGVAEDFVNSVSGKEVDTNSSSHIASRITDSMRDSANNELFGEEDSIQKWFFSQVVDSAVDSAISLYIGGKVGLGAGAASGVAKEELKNTIGGVTSFIIGSQAATRGVIDAKQSGLTDNQAVTLGVIKGIIEGVTEKYSVETILNDPTKLLSKVIKNDLARSFVSEGSEDVASNWLGRIAEQIIAQDKSQVSQRMNELKSLGLSDADAFSQVIFECMQEDTSSFLAGGLSGLAMSGTAKALGYADKKTTENKVGKAVKENENVNSLIEIAKKLSPESKAYKVAVQLEEQQKNNKKVSSSKVGQLRSLIIEQSQSEFDAEYKKVTENLHEDEKAVVDKLLNREALSEDEVKILNDNDVLKNSIADVQKKFNNLYSSTETANKAPFKSIKSIDDNTDKIDESKLKISEDGKTKVNDEVYDGAMEVVRTNPFAETVTYKMEKNGEVIEVNSENIEFSTKEEAKLNALASKYNVQTAQKFFDLYESGQDVDEYSREFNIFQNYGRLAVPLDSDKQNVGYLLNNDQKMGAYEAGLTSRKSYYQEQNIISSNAKNSKYYAYTKGNFNASAIKGIQLNETQRAFYNFFREFALRTGINVELFSSKEISGKYQGEQGSWNKNTKTIRVDINAGLKNVSDRAKIKHGMLNTFSHELTHIAELSGFYDELHEAIVSALEKRGTDFNELVKAKKNELINNTPNAKTMSDEKLTYLADVEVIANACETMLKNSKIFEDIAQGNPTLAQKIKDKLKNFIARLKQLLNKTNALTHEGKFLEECVTEFENINRIWDKAVTDGIKTANAMQAEQKNNTADNSDVRNQSRNTKHDYNFSKALSNREWSSFYSSIEKSNQRNSFRIGNHGILIPDEDGSKNYKLVYYNGNSATPRVKAVYKLENYEYNIHEEQLDFETILDELRRYDKNDEHAKTILENNTRLYGTVFKEYSGESWVIISKPRTSVSNRKNNRYEPNRTGTVIDTEQGISDSGVNDNIEYQQRYVEPATTSLEERLQGDELLDAQDIIDTIKSVNGKVDEYGNAILYHGTNKNSRDSIYQSGKMIAKEDGLFFSTKPDGEIKYYGDNIVRVKIPVEYLELNDIFNGEAHFRLPLNSDYSANVSSVLFQMRPNDDFLFDDLFDDDGIVEQSVFEKAVKDNPDNTLLAVYQHAAKTAETAITQSNDVRLDEKAYLRVARRIMQEYDISRKLNKDFDTELAEKIRMHIGRIENGVADFESELDSIVKVCQEALLLSGHLDYESKQDERDFVFGLINGKRLLVTKNGESVIKEEYGSIRNYQRKMFGHMYVALESNLQKKKDFSGGMYISDIIASVREQYENLLHIDENADDDVGYLWLDNLVNNYLEPQLVNHYIDGYYENLDTAALEMAFDITTEIINAKASQAVSSNKPNHKRIRQLANAKKQANSEQKAVQSAKLESYKKQLNGSEVSDSNRHILADLLTDSAQNEEESNIITSYKYEIDTLDSLEERLYEINKKIKEISFKKGSDRSQLADLKEQQKKLKNKIERKDKQLLKLESMDIMKKLINSEKQKASAKSAEKVRSKYQQKLKEAKEKHNEELASVKKRDRERLAKVRESKDKIIVAEREKRKDQLQKFRNNRERAVYIEKIKKLQKEFAQMATRPTDSSYVLAKELNSGFYQAALLITEAVNLDDSTKVGSALRNVSGLIQKLMDNQMTSEDVSPDFRKLVDTLAEHLEGKKINRNLTLKEAEDIYSILKQIKDTVRDSNRLLGEQERLTVIETGTKIIEEQKALKPSKINQKFNKAKGYFLTPERMNSLFTGYNENSSLTRIFNGLLKGVRNKNMFFAEANKMFDEYRNAHQKELDSSIHDIIEIEYKAYNGDTTSVNMTRMQGMQILLSWKREMNDSRLVHMQRGGIVIPDSKLLLKGKVEEAIIQGQKVYGITPDFISEIEKSMTDFEKGYMEIAEKFFNEKAKSAINSTSQVLRHRDIATSDYYIPFAVNNDEIIKTIDGVKYDASLESMGMLSSIVPKSDKSILIMGLDNVINKHIDEVSKYCGLAIPIRNFNKVMNVIQTEKDGNTVIERDSVRSALKANWGKLAVDMYEQLVTDLQTTRSNNGEKFQDANKMIKKIRSNFVTSTLNANKSVVLKQAASYTTAGAYLSGTSLTQGLWEFRHYIGNGKYQELLDKIDSHTGQHYVRRAGLSSIEISDIQANWFNSSKFGRKINTSKVMQSLPNGVNPNNWIQEMDCLTTAALWCATECEVRNNYRSTGKQINTDEYWQEVTDLYDKVIENTQPMYDPMHRPEILKTSNELIKSVFMFKTQPLQNSGIIYDAIGRMAQSKKIDKQSMKVAAGLLGKAVISQASSLVVFALMSLAVAFTQQRMNRYRDDDDELNAESIISTVLDDLMTNGVGILLPFGGTELAEFTKYLLGKSQYGDELISDNVVNIISDMTSSATKLHTTIWEQLDNASMGLEVDTDSIIKSLDDCVTSLVSGLAGFPIKNYKNNINAYILWIKDIANGGELMDANTPAKTASDYCNSYGKYYISGEQEKAKEELDELYQQKLEEYNLNKETNPEDFKSTTPEQKAKNSVRDSLVNAYKKEYQEAFLKSNTVRMKEISDLLQASGYMKWNDRLLSQKLSDWRKSAKQDLSK